MRKAEPVVHNDDEGCEKARKEREEEREKNSRNVHFSARTSSRRESKIKNGTGRLHLRGLFLWKNSFRNDLVIEPERAVLFDGI